MMFSPYVKKVIYTNFFMILYEIFWKKYGGEIFEKEMSMLWVLHN